MNDEETVALIAGGHTFGKTHGAGDPSFVGPEPEGGAIEDQGLGWKSTHGTGKGPHAITGGPEVTWSQTPTKWSNHFFDNLFKFEWELTKSPAGAYQWKAKGAAPARSGRARPVEEACADHADHRSGAEVRPGLREDLPPLLRAPGPVRRRVRPRVVQADPPRHGADPALSRPARAQGDADLAGPDPGGEPCARRGEGHRRRSRRRFSPLGSRSRELVSTAWASASTFRGSDKRGGANGARIRLAPQKDWEINHPKQLATVLAKLEAIQKEFNASAAGGKKVSLADLIVLGGGAAIEKAAKDAGHDVRVPFTPGRMDASQQQTDAHSFAPLEPYADGFRNYYRSSDIMAPEEALVDKAQLLTLTAPEMTVLLGGLRVLGANAGKSAHGVFTSKPGTLTNDFFVNLLDMSTEWRPAQGKDGVYEGVDRKTKAGQVDRNPRRPHLRLALGLEGAGRGLCDRRLEGEVRQGLRQGLDEGDEPRPLRPRRPRRARKDGGGVRTDHRAGSLTGPGGSPTPPSSRATRSNRGPSLRAKRSNPRIVELLCSLDCFVAALLAMTIPSEGNARLRSPPARDWSCAGRRFRSSPSRRPSRRR